MKKLLALSIVFAALFVLGIRVYYFRTQSKKLPSPSPTISPPIFSDWRVYQSSNFGYSISYPPNIQLHQQGKVNERILDVVSFVVTSAGKRIPILQAKISSLPYREELGKRGIKLGGVGGGEINGEKISVSGIEGVKVVSKTTDKKKLISVFLSGEDKTFILLGMPEAVPNQDYSETVNQMISTFSPNKR